MAPNEASNENTKESISEDHQLTTDSIVEENNTPSPPNNRYLKDLDQGWAWVVLGTIFVAFFIMQGQVGTSNIYFVVYLQEFHHPRSITAFVGAGYTAAMNLSGPLASILLRKYGPRIVVMLGGLFLAIGFFCNFPAQSIYHIMITNGIVRGFGGGLAMSGCQAALTKYFRKRLFVVTGIMYSASAIGMMTVGILTEYLIMYYGWRGSMMIQAGLSLQIIVFGTFVFRLPTTPSSVTNGNALSLPTTSKKARTPAKVYMKDVRFWCMSLCTTTLFMFTAIILVFWKDMMLNKDHFKAAMAGMAAGSTLGRATAGLISKKISPPIHNFILGLAGSGVVFIFLIADKLWIVVVHNFLWGFLNGQQFVADRLQLAWVYGGQEMPIVLGYTLLIVGFGSFCVPPLAGFITDQTGDYAATLAFSSACLIVGAILSLTLYCIQKRKSGTSYDIQSQQHTENKESTELQVLNKT